MDQPKSKEEDNRKPASMLEDLARGLIPLGIIGAAILFLIKFGSPPSAQTAGPAEPVVVEVVTERAKLFDRPMEVRVDGVAQPYRHISIAAEVGGRILSKNPNCNDGKYLKAGTVMYEIDPADFHTVVDRIKQELAQAENALREWSVDRSNALEQTKLAEADLQFATNDASRLKGLREKNITSEGETDQALRTEVGSRLALQNVQNQIRALDVRKARTESSIELQKIALEQAERNLQRTKIVAPVDCTVVTDDCEQDSYVQPGKIVAVLNDLSKAEVGCQLELDDLFWVWKTRSPATLKSFQELGELYDAPAIPVTVEFPFHDRLCRWEGKLERFGGTGIDLSTRTIPCRIVIDHPMQSVVTTLDGQPVDDFLPPPLATGMFVTVSIMIQPSERLLEVPATAVRSGGVIWLVREGKLKIQPVKIARRMKEIVLLHALESELYDSDQVIVSPLAVAENGMLVAEKPVQ